MRRNERWRDTLILYVKNVPTFEWILRVLLSVPDAQLIEGAAGGDTEAIEKLLDRYHPSVTRFARKFCATLKRDRQ